MPFSFTKNTLVYLLNNNNLTLNIKQSQEETWKES